MKLFKNKGANGAMTAIWLQVNEAPSENAALRASFSED